jgi:hypothetical protein
MQTQSKVVSCADELITLLAGRQVALGIHQVGIAIPVSATALIDSLAFGLYSYKIEYLPYDSDKLLVMGIEHIYKGVDGCDSYSHPIV